MNYLIAFFGSFVWNYALFVIAKNKCDAALPPVDFEYKKYVKLNWDNWGMTFLLAPIIIWFLPEIAEYSNAQILKIGIPPIPQKLYAILSGVFSELLIFGILKLAGIKQSLVAPVHKD
ncbi:hypothetical protein WSM22_02880 [Cytophagales bacterium WSM2-2]|nr:hypothetical protein WSM22_02880 [Cytophagales bacterium WSM2-2]